jgi:type IV secretory pathway VirB10-like protein
VPGDNERAVPPKHLVIDTPNPKPVRNRKERLRIFLTLVGIVGVLVVVYGFYSRFHKNTVRKEKQATQNISTESAKSPRAEKEAGINALPPGRSAEDVYNQSHPKPGATSSTPTTGTGPVVAFQPEGSPNSSYPVNNIQQGQGQLSPEEQWLKEEEDARKSPIHPDLKMAVSDGQAPRVTMSSYQPPQPSTGSLPQLPPGSAPLPPVADSPAAPAAAPTPDLSPYAKYVASLSAPASTGTEQYRQQNDQPGKEGFNSGNAPADDPYLHTKREDPLSRYEIKQGGRIPATLIPQVSSDMPGDVTALVSQDVYDTTPGKYLLIPQATRLIGHYNSNITYGQKALQVAWTRLIYPDGTWQSIDRMMGYDANGTSGLRDKTDNHIGRLAGGVLLSSLLAAGFQISQNRNNSVLQYPTASQEVGTAVGQQVTQLGQQITQRNLGVQPTEIERPGKLFFVEVNKDMVFFDGPYRPRKVSSR